MIVLIRPRSLYKVRGTNEALLTLVLTSGIAEAFGSPRVWPVLVADLPETTVPVLRDDPGRLSRLPGVLEVGASVLKLVVRP